MACRKCQNFWLSLIIIAGVMLLVATFLATGDATEE